MSPDSLPPDLAQFVSDQLALGKYDTATDVVCDAVRLLREREERLKSLRTDIQKGIEQLDAGECIDLHSDEDIDTFFDDVLARAAERAPSKE
jgi:antitoxin ParD1/3/4